MLKDLTGTVTTSTKLLPVGYRYGVEQDRTEYTAENSRSQPSQVVISASSVLLYLFL